MVAQCLKILFHCNVCSEKDDNTVSSNNIMVDQTISDLIKHVFRR